MSETVRYERRGDIAVITVDNPPVNALSSSVRQGLADSLAQGLADDAVKAFVLIGAGRTYIAGADIREFGKPMTGPGLQQLITDYENSPKPIVVAIHGTALGGGLEVALGCHYRVAVASAQLGLPEVKLGILPGAGGTQRMPRVIGVKAALDMITSGDPIPAAKAKAIGLVDDIVEGDLLEGAIKFAEIVAIPGGTKGRRISQNNDKLGDATPAFFAEARKSVAAKARGQIAPVKIVDALEAAATLPFAEGMKKEREVAVELMGGTQSKALRHVFFAEREAAKIPDVPSDTPVRPVKSVAIIGAGTMGGGIAMSFANIGIPVTLIDSTDEFLDRGLKRIKDNYAVTVSRGRLSQADMDKRVGLIKGAIGTDKIKDADMVVEAVFEEMDLKRKVYLDIDKYAKPGAVLATNTSGLNINEIAAVTKRPQDVIGLHFFSPANIMRLVEVVRAEKTGKDIIATAMQVGKQLKKVPVLARVYEGFIGNAMLRHYGREAHFLVEEGAMPQQVDKALTDFGYAMGMFAVHDLAGNDVGYRMRKAAQASRPNDRRYSDIITLLCDMGRLGQKTGKGWYRYEPGSRTPIPDPEVEALIIAQAKAKGIERRTITDEEIVKRCVYGPINEGAVLLEKGIALRPSDIDIVYVTGYGFPSWRGGPMFYADTVGLKNVLDDIKRFHERDGFFWKPAPLLEQLVREGKSFADYQAGR
ncbi:MAG TPA: 3-hydroxyacyl-CoA dehydrogenase NAD-binding domain-containing protein [Stellaceae bacterium]